MGYRKKRGSRRSRRSRGRYKRRRGGLYARSGRLMSVNPTYRQELKFFDQNVTLAALAVGGAFVFGSTLNPIPQGLDEQDRIGRLITIKRIQFSGVLTQLNAIGLDSNRVRIMLVWDKQNSGSAGANLNDVINPVVDGMRDPPNQSRFVILWNKLICMQATAGAFDGKGAAFGDTCRGIKYYKKCSIPLQFDAGLGAVTELTSNNLFMAAWMESAGPQVLITGQVRVRFTDS